MTDSTSGAGGAADSAGKAADAAAAADRAAAEAQSAAAATAAETASVEAQLAAAAQAVGAAPTPAVTQVDATVAPAAPAAPVDISIDVSTLSQLSSINVSAPTSLGGVGLASTTAGVSYADVALGLSAQQPSTPTPPSTGLGFSAIGKVDGLTQDKINNGVLNGISFSAGVAYNGLNTRAALEARMNPSQQTLTGVAGYSYTDPLAGPGSINALGIEAAFGLLGTNANAVKGSLGVTVDETTSLNFDALASFQNLDFTGASFTGKVTHALSDRLNAELSGQVTTNATDFTGAVITGKISGTTPSGLYGYGSATGRYNAATDTWSGDFRVGAGGKF